VLSLLFFSLSLLNQPHLKKPIVAAICAVVFFIGIIKAYLAPTFQTIMSSMVSKEFLPSATTWNSAIWLLGGILGHAIAGFSIAYLGVAATLIFIASLIFCAFFMLFLIFPKPPVTAKTGIGINNWHQFKEGLQFITSNKVLLGAVSLDLFTVFFGGIVAIIPAVAKDIFHAGPVGFAWLNVAADIGSVTVLIFLILSPLKRRQGLKLFFTVAVFGVSIIVFAFSRSFVLSFAALVVSGMADAVNSVIRGTILQLKTPDYIRGRVMSISSVFTNSSNELGRLESGLAASFLGTMPSIFFGGAMALFIVVITFIKTPKLRKLEY
jgi:MFS family permease